MRPQLVYCTHNTIIQKGRKLTDDKKSVGCRFQAMLLGLVWHRKRSRVHVCRERERKRNVRICLT